MALLESVAMIFALILYVAPPVTDDLLFALAWVLIWAHIGSETVGRFWRYTEREFGAGLEDRTGYALFAALLAVQLALAYLGFVAGHRWAVAVLVGVMITDAVLSHLIQLAVLGVPNPGLLTAVPYLLFAVVVAVNRDPSVWWALLGALPFVTTWAALFALRWYLFQARILFTVEKRNG